MIFEEVTLHDRVQLLTKKQGIKNRFYLVGIYFFGFCHTINFI